jgi:hypothetical protein
MGPRFGREWDDWVDVESKDLNMPMHRRRTLGLNLDGSNYVPEERDVVRYIDLKLASLDEQPAGESSLVEFASDLIAHFKEQARLLRDYLCPADRRIQDFLARTLGGVIDESKIQLPSRTLVLDRHGIARELSLPIGEHSFSNEILSSYRTKQGVLHNPKADRRTTAGVFHVADVGLPVPLDKYAVPVVTYARLLEAAMKAPADLLRLPFTSKGAKPVEIWCSLLLRPLVAPEVPGVRPEKRTEIRFFAPGGLVCNLDFVESIFGNARTTQAWTCSGGPGTPGASSSRPTSWGSTRRHWGYPTSPRRPSGRSARGCAGRRRTRSTTAGSRSRSRAAAARGSWSRSWRTTTSATARRR